MPYDWRLNTIDRVAQVGWLDEFAGNIASQANVHGDSADEAEEIVNYFLSKRGMREWNIELPGWFDDHDRAMLVEKVAAQI